MNQNRKNKEGLKSCPRLHSSKKDAMEAMNDLKHALKPRIKNSEHNQSASKIYRN